MESKLLSIEDTISKIKFISKLKKGEKFSIRNMYTQPPGLQTTITRTIFCDSRKDSIEFIRYTINAGIEIVEKYQNSKKPHKQKIAINLIQDLIQCQSGIKNLMETYSDDRMFQSEMETVLQMLKTKIEN